MDITTEKPTTFLERVFKISIIRFGVVGLISTIIDIGFSRFFGYLGAPIWLYTGIGFLCGATNGYLMNTYFVFFKSKNGIQYSKYLIITAIGLGFTEIIVNYLTHSHSLEWLQAKLIAVVIVFFWNYFGSKIWAFK